MIIANWKSNGGHQIIKDWCYDFSCDIDISTPAREPYIGIAPPALFVHLLESDLHLKSVHIGLQDVDHSSGSRTGAISVEMLEDHKVEFAIVGHSERREIFNEDNDLIKEKLKSLNKRITSILCIGETKEENAKGITKDILKDQLEIVNELDLDKSFTVAYEPVWAIGSGLTPDPKDINEIHKYIKDVVQSNSANNLIPKVLYGGSVTDKNAESFFKEEFVDGALVGGASLDGSTFARIVNIFNGIEK